MNGFDLKKHLTDGALPSCLQAFDADELAAWTNELDYFMADAEAETATVGLTLRIGNYEATNSLHGGLLTLSLNYYVRKS